MKYINISALVLFVWLICFLPAKAQYNTIKYASHGYFTGMDFSKKNIIETSVFITIEQNRVKIMKVDLSNPANDKMIYESRTLSALKYPAIDGELYYVWKLGDRKMVLRKLNGERYLSLYQTDEFGLPNEYITYLISD